MTEEQITISIIIAVCTFLYTISSILLWMTAKQSTNIIQKQLEDQSISSSSLVQHSIVEAHRELYLSIINNPSLIKIYSKEAGIGEEIIKKKYLASLLINHSLSLYLNYKNEIGINENLEGFIRDARELYSYPFIIERWNEVKTFHPKNFKNFMEKYVIKKV